MCFGPSNSAITRSLQNLRNAPSRASQQNEQLMEAAFGGDVNFLRNCVASNKSMEYYLTVFETENIRRGYKHTVNMFHIAVYRNNREFIREAIQILPLEATQHLLLQQSGINQDTPLHVAAFYGNIEIVKMFLNVPFFSSEQKPWLIEDCHGNTPCHSAFHVNNQEGCGLEILRMDLDLLSNMNDSYGESLLYTAVFKGFNKCALEILNNSSSFSSAGLRGYTPLHAVTRCSEVEGQEIERLLLEREPKMVEQISDHGRSILHNWAISGEVWPFEVLLNSNDIIPNVAKFVHDLLSTCDQDYVNPLHCLALNDVSNKVVKITKLLVDTYKQEADAQITGDLLPWYMQDEDGCTPLDLAISYEAGGSCSHNKDLAIYIMSADNYALIKCQSNPLITAIRKGFQQVAENILEIVKKNGWDQLLTDQQHIHVLHYAPRCGKKFLEWLVKCYPSFLEEIDKDGNTIFHTWMEIGELWPFECVLQGGKMDVKRRSDCIKHISTCAYKSGNNPIHIATTGTNEVKDEIVKLLVEAYKEGNPHWKSYLIDWLPWFTSNIADNYGPLHMAIINNREKLALYILSLNFDPMADLLDNYTPEHKTLFLAIEKNCFSVAKEILTKLDKSTWTKYLKNNSDDRSILHLAPNCSNIEFGKWLLETTSEFLDQQDKDGKTPLEVACEVGAVWFIQQVRDWYPSAYSNTPLAWIKACEKGHVQALCAFIEKSPGYFRDLCIKHKTTPLHHLKLPIHVSYKELLHRFPLMVDLINVRDSDGATPLHRAIEHENIYLTEALLSIDKILYNIKDGRKRMAIDMLEEKYTNHEAWEEMCSRIGFDPTIKTTYFQHKTNLLDVRNTLSVVAALLATITFTAGFTIPGGFNQDTGISLLAKKPVFCVFLISNTLAMCLSMLVLICLVWSMVYDTSKSLFFIDRSMRLLMLALYSTLLAFMSGVYVVISPKSLWAAVLVICMCSFLGIAASRTLLYRMLNLSDPFRKKKHDQTDPLQSA